MISSLFDKQWLRAKNQATTSDETIEHGWEQHVLIDHENEIVYRYPRNANAAAKLEDEVSILDRLQYYKWPVKIPHMIKHTATYSAYRYIPGVVADSTVVQTLSDTETRHIGEQLGRFFAVMHSVEHSAVYAKKTKQQMTLLEYYSARIERSPDSANKSAALNDLRQLTDGTAREHVVVHGDLHGLNMVLDPDSKELVGVIDFSELEIGEPSQDFRKIYMAEPRFLAPAIAAYHQHSPHRLSSERVLLWAYVNEWANICYFAEHSDNPTYQRAFRHLQKWGKI